jgi:hypothetical protein
MNKFEALKQFQEWPPEWQRLCAEYWIETGEDRPEIACGIEARFRNGEPVSIPFDQPKAAKVAAIPRDIQERICNGESVFFPRNDSHLSDFNSAMGNAKATGKPAAAKVAVKPARNFMRYTRDELTEVDSHVSEGRGPSEVARIMDKKYPRQRTIDAWEKMANRIKKAGLQAMLDRAIDVEFK